MRYADGNETRYAQEQLFLFDSEDTLPNTEYIEQLDEKSLFTDGIKAHLIRLENKPLPEDVKSIIRLLVSYCKKAGVDISRQTLENWFSRSAPSGNRVSRENVYKLCFALRMNDNQTREFFLKSYLERPFNYKNTREAVYFYCMRKGIGYSDADRIICSVESSSCCSDSASEAVTEYIGNAIEKIESEKELIDFLSRNRASFVNQNLTATRKIEALLKACMPLAEKEYQKRYSHQKHLHVNSVDALLGVIYSYFARRTENCKRVQSTTIKNSDFPTLIKRNFPEQQEFSNINNGKASFDAIRKALIMLTFYHFFASAFLQEACSSDLFDEFTEEMDAVLMECGYVQLYWRNPYDWMIGFCAFSDDPLETLRDFIDEYYLSINE